MNLATKFVQEEMTSDERKQLIADYEDYEASGTTGDTVLRAKAEELNGYLNMDDPNFHITFRMQELMLECCRYYAKLALDLE